MKIKTSFREFKKTMKGLTVEERIDHIWAYYKLELLMIILIPIMIIGLITWLSSTPIETVFSGNITNINITNEGYSYLRESYLETIEGDPETQKIDLSISTTAGKNIANTSDVGVDEGVRVAAMVAAGSLDYIITDQIGLEYYAVQGAFEDISAVLTEQQLAAFEDAIYYHTDAESGKRYAVAINISELAFAKDCLENDKPVYLGFSINAPHAEQLQAFFNFLLQWQEK